VVSVVGGVARAAAFSGNFIIYAFAGVFRQPEELVGHHGTAPCYFWLAYRPASVGLR